MEITAQDTPLDCHVYIVHRLLSFNDVRIETQGAIETVWELKAKIADATGVLPQFQTLVAGGKWINSDNALQSVQSVRVHHTHLHLICSPDMQSPLRVIVTLKGQTRQDTGATGCNSDVASRPATPPLKKYWYTIQANQSPTELGRFIERDSGVPPAQQCLLVSGPELALDQMALLCEYSSNGRDLHLNLVQSFCCDELVEKDCCVANGTREAAASGRRGLRRVALTWMDHTSSVLEINIASATLRGLKESLYAQHGIPPSAYNFSVNGRLLIGAEEESLESVLGTATSVLPTLRLVPSSCAVFFDEIGVDTESWSPQRARRHRRRGRRRVRSAISRQLRFAAYSQRA